MKVSKQDIKDLLKHKKDFVKQYGKDAEKVMYGKVAKEKKENNPMENRIKEACRKALSKKQNIKEWGSSDTNAMLHTMHSDLGNPTEFPGFSEIVGVAEDAVDQYWDDWEEYKTDRESLVKQAFQGYMRRYFPDYFNKASKMVSERLRKK